MNFAAVILAGGQSRRMGQDKARLFVDGQSLLARQIGLARSLAASEIFISGRAGNTYSEFDLPVIFDPLADAGPLSGIERALTITSKPLLLVLAVDMPGLTKELLMRLQTSCPDGRGAVPRLNGQLEPLAAFYPRSAHRVAATLLAHRPALRDFAQQCERAGLVKFYDVGVADAHCFSNWNTPEDITLSD
jgi:molybdenum cofactor guanylyltransferase